MDKPLTIALLCRNRPELAREAIDSILAQTSNAYHLLLSDNSTNDAMRGLWETQYPGIAYIHWGGHLSHFQHVAQIISRTQTPYLTIFHDDDRMMPDYVTAILHAFGHHPQAAAIAANSLVMDAAGSLVPGKVMVDVGQQNTIFNNGQEIVLRYLDIDLGGIVPFNAYAYNLSILQGLTPDETLSRHYTDTVFLAQVANCGPVIWLAQPHIITRVHPNNISHACGTRDYKLFIQWVRQQFGTRISRQQIDLYRIPHLFHELEKRRRMPKAALWYLARSSPRLLAFSKNYRQRFIRKAWQKLNLACLFRQSRC